MPNELYRDYIDGKADEIINSLGGTITPAPANAELYRDFLDRKFDDVISAIGNVKVKSFKYTGNGNMTNIIKFPTIPTLVLSIDGVQGTISFLSAPIHHDSNWIMAIYRRAVNTGSGASVVSKVNSFVDDTLEISNNSTYPSDVFNVLGCVYTVYYI